MTPQVAILAAGMGTRLGRPFPKPLTQLATGKSIMAQQLDHVTTVLGSECRITIVVGFKMDLIMEVFPEVLYAYNENYSETNTARSLARVLQLSGEGGLLWLNGDVVFDPRILEKVRGLLEDDTSFVCVNTAAVGAEEVKYTVDAQGNIDQLSKTVVDGLGEAVGINYVSGRDKATLLQRLRECADQDYFERGIELAIAQDGLHFLPVDISEFGCVEVDFEDDLARANTLG